MNHPRLFKTYISNHLYGLTIEGWISYCFVLRRRVALVFFLRRIARVLCLFLVFSNIFYFTAIAIVCMFAWEGLIVSITSGTGLYNENRSLCNTYTSTLRTIVESLYRFSSFII